MPPPLGGGRESIPGPGVDQLSNVAEAFRPPSGDLKVAPTLVGDLVQTDMTRKKTTPRLVKIGVARDEMEAAMWRDALEQDGIAAFVRNVDTLSVAQYSASGLPYSFELYVGAADAKRARWILGLRSSGEERQDQ